MAGTLPEELGSCFPELNSFKYSFNQVDLGLAQALLLLARQLLSVVSCGWKGIVHVLVAMAVSCAMQTQTIC